jgi:hypothetical protein
MLSRHAVVVGRSRLMNMAGATGTDQFRDRLSLMASTWLLRATAYRAASAASLKVSSRIEMP